MDFRKIHETYGDKLSFHGSIGTQSVMPFGTPEDVRRKVFENLDIAGPKGGLSCAPPMCWSRRSRWKMLRPTSRPAGITVSRPDSFVTVPLSQTFPLLFVN